MCDLKGLCNTVSAGEKPLCPKGSRKALWNNIAPSTTATWEQQHCERWGEEIHTQTWATLTCLNTQTLGCEHGAVWGEKKEPQCTWLSTGGHFYIAHPISAEWWRSREGGLLEASPVPQSCHTASPAFISQCPEHHHCLWRNIQLITLEHRRTTRRQIAGTQAIERWENPKGISSLNQYTQLSATGVRLLFRTGEKKRERKQNKPKKKRVEILRMVKKTEGKSDKEREKENVCMGVREAQYRSCSCN